MTLGAEDHLVDDLLFENRSISKPEKLQLSASFAHFAALLQKLYELHSIQSPNCLVLWYSRLNKRSAFWSDCCVCYLNPLSVRAEKIGFQAGVGLPSFCNICASSSMSINSQNPVFFIYFDWSIVHSRRTKGRSVIRPYIIKKYHQNKPSQ